MADQYVDMLLVGGGVASANAAKTLRAEGFQGSVLLTTREQDPPYRRPPSSKKYLQGRARPEDAYVLPAGWWEEHDVQLRPRTSVLSLDTDARVATLATKETLSYGQALIATGATVRRLRVPGCELDGIHYLRTPGNADTIRRDLDGAENVLCVGGSYIASEVAASLTSIGYRVTMVMLEEEPLSRQFGTTVGRFFRRVLEEHGVTLISGDEVKSIVGKGERVVGVVTAAGRSLSADLMVCGVGAMPDVMLARKARLEIGALGGVVCDTRLRTSVDGIFAAGDMCEYESVVHGRVVRIEHENVAETQGATAARNMLGADAAYDTVPYFFSDLSDWASLEYVGPAYAWDDEIVSGSLEDGVFSVWYLEGSQVRGVLSVGGHGDLDTARDLIRSGAAVSAGDL